MARGHRLNTSIVLAAVHGLSGLFRAVSAVEPSLFCPPPPPLHPTLSPSLISHFAFVDVKQNGPVLQRPLSPVSLQRQVVYLLLRPVFMCSSQASLHCFLVGVIKSYVTAASDFLTLHSCFQPASLTPHPAPLHIHSIIHQNIINTTIEQMAIQLTGKVAISLNLWPKHKTALTLADETLIGRWLPPAAAVAVVLLNVLGCRLT